MGRGLKIWVVATSAALATVGMAAAPAMAGVPQNTGCPTSSTRLTIEQAVALPRTQAAITAGLTTADQVRAVYGQIDANGNGSLCVALPPGFENPQSHNALYFYSFADDKHA